jgi:hypothetical protein
MNSEPSTKFFERSYGLSNEATRLAAAPRGLRGHRLMHLLRTQGLGETKEVLRNHANDAPTRTINIRN